MTVPNATLEHLYEVFASYEFDGKGFCSYCYLDEEMKAIAATPVRSLSGDMAWGLLIECADHWPGADAYRRYLPRLLELMDSPSNLEDAYPTHLSETLLNLGFRSWPEIEQTGVLRYLEYLGPRIYPDRSGRDWQEWEGGMHDLLQPEGENSVSSREHR